MERYLQLMKALPPLVAAVVWDVVNRRIDENTIELAQATTKEDFDRNDVVRCVAAANPNYPPLDLAKELVDEMVEDAVVAR